MRALRPDEPRAIGGYRLVGVIGAGGMGRVFLAVAPDGRLAAVKQVLTSVAGDAGFRERFVREVQASRAVSGAYSAAVLDTDPHAETPWLASVFVPGPSLAEAVAATGPLPEPAVRRLAAGTAAALADIHRAGLVHRDVKPANVLLTEDGPRVVDFGIAHTTATAAGGLTSAGTLLGTAGYLAPEQFDGRRAGPPADMFALGVVLAYAATGTGLFHAETPHGMLYQVAVAEPDLSLVPPGLRPMITALVAKDPEHRPTPQQILQRIGPVQPGADWLPDPVRRMAREREHEAHVLAGARPGGPRPAADPVRPPRRRRLLVVAAALLVAVAVVAGVLVAVTWRGDTLSAEDATALVAEIMPPPGEFPLGFRFFDDAATPNLDGRKPSAPTPPRATTRLACDINGDPPAAAEAGLVAGASDQYVEDVDQLPDRLPDLRSVAVYYVDEAHRGQIVGEVQLRIGACRTAVPTGFTRWAVGTTIVPGVDEQVAFVATLPVPVAFPDFPPQVLSCTLARVDAVLLRACTLVTSAAGDPDPITGTGDRVGEQLRDLLAPVVVRARALQAGG